jgi:hypothetical protein
VKTGKEVEEKRQTETKYKKINQSKNKKTIWRLRK